MWSLTNQFSLAKVRLKITTPVNLLSELSHPINDWWNYALIVKINLKVPGISVGFPTNVWKNVSSGDGKKRTSFRTCPNKLDTLFGFPWDTTHEQQHKQTSLWLWTLRAKIVRFSSMPWLSWFLNYFWVKRRGTPAMPKTHSWSCQDATCNTVWTGIHRNFNSLICSMHECVAPFLNMYAKCIPWLQKKNHENPLHL